MRYYMEKEIDMPLIHSSSDKARSENIRREIEAGKPRAQAAAIGYSVQRQAEKHSTPNSHKPRGHYK